MSECNLLIVTPSFIYFSISIILCFLYTYLSINWNNGTSVSYLAYYVHCNELLNSILITSHLEYLPIHSIHESVRKYSNTCVSCLEPFDWQVCLFIEEASVLSHNIIIHVTIALLARVCTCTQFTTRAPIIGWVSATPVQTLHVITIVPVGDRWTTFVRTLDQCQRIIAYVVPSGSILGR